MKHILLLAILLLCAPAQAQVAQAGTECAFGSVSNGTSQSCTAPADACLAVFHWGGYVEGGTGSMATVSYGGNAMTIVVDTNTTATDFAMGIAYLVNPPAGANNVTWDWDGTAFLDPQANYIMQWFTGCDTANPIRDSDVNIWGDVMSQTDSVSLTSASNDYVEGMVMGWLCTDGANSVGAPGGSGQTVDVDDNNHNCYGSDLFHEDSPGGSSTVLSATANFGGVTGISIRAAAVSSSNAVKRRRFR